MAKRIPSVKDAPAREPMALSKKTVIEPDPLPQGADDDSYDESDESRPEAAPQGVQLSDAPITQNDLARSQIQLAGAIQTLADSQPVKRVPWSKFKTRSPFNPTGNKKRKLTRRIYQNGYPVNIKKLFDEEIAMFNKIEPGRYMEGLVTIVKVQTGGNTDLHVVYNNKSFDQRLALKSNFRNLREMLSICLDEMKQRGKTVVTV